MQTTIDLSSREISARSWLASADMSNCSDSYGDFDISDTEVDIFGDEEESLSSGDAAMSSDDTFQTQPIFNDPSVLVNFRVGWGPTPTTFLIHQEMVCIHSPVLEAALTGPFREHKSGFMSSMTYQRLPSDL